MPYNFNTTGKAGPVNEVGLRGVVLNNNRLVYLIGNNAAEGENHIRHIKYANSFLMKCTVNNTYLTFGSYKLYVTHI